MPIKLIDSIHYHLWTDALHARQLARTTKDEWDRGAYVRWSVTTAWTVFENFAADVLDAKGLGMRFTDRFNEALAAKSLKAVDWGAGIWQRALAVYEWRKRFTHVAAVTDSAVLTPPTTDAELAISTVREAIRALAAHAGVPSPLWVEDDAAGSFAARGGGFTQGMMVLGGADENDPEHIRITYIYEGKEHVEILAPPGTAWEPLVDRMEKGLNAPATAIRAYRGQTLLHERPLRSRRSGP